MTKTIEDLVENQESTLIFFWDELPLMIYNIKQHSGEDTAMELLDTLRSLRMTHSDLRMVFTGSIGLHNVITSLKKAGYANDPTNEMKIVDVPVLSPDKSLDLAHRLLEGEKIPIENLEFTAKVITEEVDHFPYYIHHVVDKLKSHDGNVNIETVKETVTRCLTDPQDIWHINHYRERIDTYYTQDERRFTLAVLDSLATSGLPISFDKLFNLVKSQVTTEDSEMVRQILTLLQRDQYILLESDGKYCFRFSLIQRWWALHRGLN